MFMAKPLSVPEDNAFGNSNKVCQVSKKENISCVVLRSLLSEYFNFFDHLVYLSKFGDCSPMVKPPAFSIEVNLFHYVLYNLLCSIYKPQLLN